jgi:hypothetical protein
MRGIDGKDTHPKIRKKECCEIGISLYGTTDQASKEGGSQRRIYTPKKMAKAVMRPQRRED